MQDDRYVLRHEWEDSKGKIYERINQESRKQTEQMSSMNSKLERYTALQEQSFDSQKKSEQHLEKLNETMSKIGGDMIDIKYTVKSHEERITTIQGSIDSKQKGSIQILVAIISSAGVVIAAAFGAAHLFF